MRYKARKDVVVGGTGPGGVSIGPISFAKGTYTTNDPDEIALLDAVAELPDNPVGFDPKEK